MVVEEPIVTFLVLLVLPMVRPVKLELKVNPETGQVRFEEKLALLD